MDIFAVDEHLTSGRPSKRRMTLAVVVLPQPDSPTSAKVSMSNGEANVIDGFHPADDFHDQQALVTAKCFFKWSTRRLLVFP
jgi:hypothetical protein